MCKMLDKDIQAIYEVLQHYCKDEKEVEKKLPLACIAATMPLTEDDSNETWYSIIFNTKASYMPISEDEILIGTILINDVKCNVTAEPTENVYSPLFKFKGKANFTHFVKLYGADLYNSCPRAGKFTPVF